MENRSRKQGNLLEILKTIYKFPIRKAIVLKAYHKANEERKEVHQELVDTRDQITKAKNEKLSRTSILSNEMPSVARRKSVYHPTNNQSSPSLFLPSISNSSYEQQNEYSGSGRKSD